MEPGSVWLLCLDLQCCVCDGFCVRAPKGDWSLASFFIGVFGDRALLALDEAGVFHVFWRSSEGGYRALCEHWLECISVACAFLGERFKLLTPFLLVIGLLPAS